ncbi:MAG: CBU_0592 family membrane protein [Flavisolibacter sp.]
MRATDWIGAMGVAITLFAYGCMSLRWMSAHSRLFFMLNTIGALLTCLASYLISYWPFFVLEGTWATVSLVGWLRAAPGAKPEGD